MMTEHVNLILHVGTILVLALVIRVVWATRQGILWVLKATLLGVLGFAVAQLILVQLQRSREEVVIGSCMGAALAMMLTPKRSRHVPASVRRRVIERDLKHEPYDPRKHHIDHRWPFSRGGSNTADNLRVIPKEENLRKGAKKPRLRDWF